MGPTGCCHLTEVWQLTVNIGKQIVVAELRRTNIEFLIIVGERQCPLPNLQRLLLLPGCLQLCRPGELYPAIIFPRHGVV